MLDAGCKVSRDQISSQSAACGYVNAIFTFHSVSLRAADFVFYVFMHRTRASLLWLRLTVHRVRSARTANWLEGANGQEMLPSAYAGTYYAKINNERSIEMKMKKKVKKRRRRHWLTLRCDERPAFYARRAHTHSSFNEWNLQQHKSHVTNSLSLTICLDAHAVAQWPFVRWFSWLNKLRRRRCVVPF